MSDRKRHLRSYFWICLHFTSWLNISTGIIDWHFYLDKPNSHSWSRHPFSLSFPLSRKSNSTILNPSCHLCFISLKPQLKASANPTGSASLLHPACTPTHPSKRSRGLYLQQRGCCSQEAILQVPKSYVAGPLASWRELISPAPPDPTLPSLAGESWGHWGKELTPGTGTSGSGSLLTCLRN